MCDMCDFFFFMWEFMRQLLYQDTYITNTFLPATHRAGSQSLFADFEKNILTDSLILRCKH